MSESTDSKYSKLRGAYMRHTTISERQRRRRVAADRARRRLDEEDKNRALIQVDVARSILTSCVGKNPAITEKKARLDLLWAASDSLRELCRLLGRS